MEGRETGGRRIVYTRLNRATSYASECAANGDADGEFVALKHAFELVIELLGVFYEDEDEGGDGTNAVELHGVRGVPRAVPDFQEAGAQEEEGSRQDDVVPVLQGRDEAQGAVLSDVARRCYNCGLSHVEEHAEGQLVCWLDPSLGRAVKQWQVCPRHEWEE